MTMDWKKRRRLLGGNLILLALLFLLVTLNKEYLRPAFGHGAFLGPLMGCLPNFLAALLISLAAVNGILSRRPGHSRILAYAGSSLVFLILTVEELRPMWGASTQYDPFDIAASAAGSLTAILVFELVQRRRRTAR
jgi:hypothetical protein